MTPANSGGVGVYNPATDIFEIVAPVNSDSNAYIGAVALNDGSIIMIPHSSPSIGICLGLQKGKRMLNLSAYTNKL